MSGTAKSLAPSRFTSFRSLYDNDPQTHLLEDISGMLSFRECADKEGVPLLCAAEFLPGEKRSIRGVKSINLMIMDIDDASEDAVKAMLAGIVTLGLQHAWHTTHSHVEGLKNGFFKCRVILFPDRPIEPNEWLRFWLYINQNVGDGLLDEACKDPCRIYFLPSHSPADKDSAHIEMHEGELLDVDGILADAPELANEAPAFPAPSEGLLASIQTSIRYKLCEAHIHKCAPAIEGQHGDLRTFITAHLSMDFALTKEEFMPLFLEWNARCKPPWSEKDLEKKLDNAQSYRDLKASPIGWRLANETVGDHVTSKDLRNIADKLCRKTNNKGGIKGRRLRLALDGEPIGAQAKDIFHDIAETIAEHFPEGEPATIAAHLSRSLEVTRNAGNKDICTEWMIQNITRAQADYRAKKMESFLVVDEHRASLMHQAWMSTGEDRDTPYTPDELTAIYDDSGVKSSRFAWVVQVQGFYYFYVNGQYKGPKTDKDSLVSAEIYMAPTGKTLMKYTDKGPAPMSNKDIVISYGVLADSVETDMTAQKSYYDYERQIIVEAPCPLRDLKPAYSERVETWLNVITEDAVSREKMLDWLATVTQIADPTCALFVYGLKGSGKNLLAHGMSRLWRKGPLGPTDLNEAADKWVDAVTQCPLLYGDESIPLNKRGDPDTEFLRKLITNHSMSLTRRYKTTTRLIGAVRVFIGANNSDVLVSSKVLSEADNEAVHERFLCLEVTTRKAEQYLTGLRVAGDADEFFNGDEIPRHLLFLRDSRTVKRTSRYLVEGNLTEELAFKLRTTQGLTNLILELLCKYFLQGKDAANVGSTDNDKPFIKATREGRSRLLISSLMLQAMWRPPYLKGNRKVPETSDIGKALATICRSGRVTVNDKKYREVRVPTILRWASNEAIAETALTNALLGFGWEGAFE